MSKLLQDVVCRPLVGVACTGTREGQDITEQDGVQAVLSVPGRTLALVWDPVEEEFHIEPSWAVLPVPEC